MRSPQKFTETLRAVAAATPGPGLADLLVSCADIIVHYDEILDVKEQTIRQLRSTNELLSARPPSGANWSARGLRRLARLHHRADRGGALVTGRDALVLLAVAFLAGAAWPRRRTPRPPVVMRRPDGVLVRVFVDSRVIREAA